jgi:hypothetical protein
MKKTKSCGCSKAKKPALPKRNQRAAKNKKRNK